MAWFKANWLWVVIVITLIGMNRFGHGGHCGLSGHNGEFSTKQG